MQNFVELIRRKLNSFGAWERSTWKLCRSSQFDLVFQQCDVYKQLSSDGHKVTNGSIKFNRSAWFPLDLESLVFKFLQEGDSTAGTSNEALRESFVSRVTEFLVFKRMPWLQFSFEMSPNMIHWANQEEIHWDDDDDDDDFFGTPDFEQPPRGLLTLTRKKL